MRCCKTADVQTAVDIACRYGASVIEDAAQALGASHGGRSVGLTGDIGLFSLAVDKGLTIYAGGLLLARDPELREALTAASREVVRASLAMEWRRSLQLLGYTALSRPAFLALTYGRSLRRGLAAGDPVAAVGDDFGPKIPLHTVGRWRQASAHGHWSGCRRFSRSPAGRHVHGSNGCGGSTASPSSTIRPAAGACGRSCC